MPETPFPKLLCKMGENIGIFQGGAWRYFNVWLAETLPASSQMINNFGAVTAASNIAKAAATLVTASENELLQLRFKPLDEDIEVVVYMPAGSSMNATNYVQARISRATEEVDPYWESTEFVDLGTKRDPQFQIYNVGSINRGQSRVLFWGRRYRLVPLASEPSVYTRVAGESIGQGRAA